jgi:hypothetical protein
LLQPPVTSSLLSPNILLDTLFSSTLSLCSSLYVTDQVSHPYKTMSDKLIENSVVGRKMLSVPSQLSVGRRWGGTQWYEPVASEYEAGILHYIAVISRDRALPLPTCAPVEIRTDSVPQLSQTLYLCPRVPGRDTNRQHPAAESDRFVTRCRPCLLQSDQWHKACSVCVCAACRYRDKPVSVT